MLDEGKYKGLFRGMTGQDPFDYQVRVARLLADQKNVLLRAPTGAGKTWAVFVPFLSALSPHKPNRLIYALPLRTLAQGVFREATKVVTRAQDLGLVLNPPMTGPGYKNESCYVTLQTGEQPDDPFFNRGRIIVTTYDQVLSGLLESPYGLSKGLHNINAAAVAGALVVFDEFHLMPPDKAFLTAVAGMHLFRELCQCVWMTATATPALQSVLRDALAAELVPGSPAQWEALLQSLPAVTTVRRDIVMEPKPITADVVLHQHRNRSIVLFNQVRRAQQFYRKLHEEAEARRLGADIILLHSRFFKGDRRSKEDRLRKLFGRGSQANAILISTQVIEAGVDISCEHLHTELCPANSLIQRAGRCARFEREEGTVHVYPLPEEDRAWLPYGNEREEGETLAATRSLLEDVQRAALNPSVVDEWVQRVHEAEDRTALREGWSARLIECLRCVENVAVHRQESGVAHLIRGDDEDQVRLIVSREVSLPETPGMREGLSVRRKSLFALLRGPVHPVGWSWDLSGDEPTWKQLETIGDIAMTYVVCLKPETAAYDSDVGLRLGEAGDKESPPRQEPRRPGVAALHREPWTTHAQKVARETQRRLEEDELMDGGLVGWGFEHRYGLHADLVRRAARACALLHDLGKLQTGWQAWAESYQRAKDPSYQHTTPLAHTDFDSQNQRDWAIQRGLGLRRPPHSAASAYYGAAFLARLLGGLRDLECVASACAVAILGHHGGWWSDVGPLTPNAGSAVSQLLGWNPSPQEWSKVSDHKDKKGMAEALLKLTVAGNALPEWWPLAAYLTRLLRLSDQRATSETAANE
jgi:CRISPR-associated endonuclease/helicase Cas3